MLLNRARPAMTGIGGLDAVLHGGFSNGRTTVVIGGPGSGKTVLATQFLVNGATLFDEPGLLVSFEESPDALRKNFPALAWPADDGAVGVGVQFIDGRMPEDAVASGSFDLGGLIAIAASIVKKNGIKRLAIDGIDALFALTDDPASRRREILRVLAWLSELGATAVVTVKFGENEGPPCYYDLAEYAADGVIKLNTTLVGELSRRTLSVVKMRGAGYEAGAHPYIISECGVRVLHSPVRTALIRRSPEGRLSTGVERLDLMLLGGYRAGTTTLISGTPGASKTTLAASFLVAGHAAGERALYVGFDEPAEQMVLDMQSVGLDLQAAREAQLLRVESFAAGSVIGDEHYLKIEELIDEHQPTRVVIDPISALDKAGGSDIADAIRERLVVLLKSRGITAIFTAVAVSMDGESEMTRACMSTIADTWIHLGFANRGGERNRTLTVLKSRGTGHSNQVREMVLSAAGIDLADVYTSGGETLSGTERALKEQQNAVEREQAEVTFATELETLDREGRDLAQSLKEAQRGLDDLAEHRADLLKRSAATGRNRARDIDLIHALRRGDAEDA